MDYQKYHCEGECYKIPVELFNKLLDQNCPEIKSELIETIKTKDKIINKLLEQNKKNKEKVNNKDRFKKIIINKKEEIEEEFNDILKNNKTDLEYITLCTNQYNSMMCILSELLEELLW